MFIRNICCFILFLISAENVFAVSGTFGFEVVIQKPDNSYLQDPNVDFKFTVTDDSGTCVIYSEDHNGVDMSGTNGQKTFQLGNTLLQTYPNPMMTTLTIDQVFSSSGVVYNCQGGGTYTSTASASRKVIMEFNDGSGLQTLPAMAINSVPYAVEAQKVVNNSITTQNILDGTITAADLSSMGAVAGQVMKWNGSAWVASQDLTGTNLVTSVAGRTGAVVLSSSDISGLGTLAGKNQIQLSTDVTGTLPLANIAQSSATTGQVIKWNGSAWVVSDDNSGLADFSSLTSADITGKLGYTPVNPATAVISVAGRTGAVTLSSSDISGITFGTTSGTFAQGNDSRLSDTRTPTDNTVTSAKIVDGTIVSADISAAAITFDKLNQSAATTGQVIKWNGSAWIASADSSSGGTVISVTASGPLSSSGGANPNITLARATASVDGYLASTDFSTFAAKLSDFSSLTSADITGKLGYTPVNPATAVISVAGRTGAVTLSSSDISGITFGTTSGTFAQGNDSRLSDTRTPTDNTVTSAKIVDGTIVSADISAAAITFDKLNQSAATTGQVIKWNGSAWIASADSSSGGTVISVTASGPLSSSGGANPNITLARATASVDGYLASTDFSTFAAKLSNFSSLTSADITGKLGYTPVNPATAVISVAGRTGAVTLSSSDISGITFGTTSGTFAQGNDSRLSDTRTPTDNTVTSAKIVDGTIVSADISAAAITFDKLNQSAATTGQVIKWNGSAWIASADSSSGGTVISVTASGPLSSSGGANPNITLARATASVDGYLASTDFSTFAAKLSNFSSLTSADITGKLGYTPVNPAGDTMTGALNLPSNGLVVGASQLVVVGGKIGIGNIFPSYSLDISDNVRLAGSRIFDRKSYTRTLNATSWYRILTLPSSAQGQYVKATLWQPDGHDNTVIELRKNTTGNGMGWTAEIYKGGAYEYSQNVTDVRVVDDGTNLPSHIDIKVGSAVTSKTFELSTEIDGSVFGYTLTYDGFTDQGSASAGVVFPVTRVLRSYGSALSATPVFTIKGDGNVGIGTSSPSVGLDVSGKTDAVRLPAGTTAQRPAAPANGDIRYNSTLGQLEAYVASAWKNLGGGTITHTTVSSTPYTVTSGQAGVYLTYNNAASGTINLPALSGLSDGWQITIARQVPQSLTIATNGADTFDNGLTTLEMQGQNIKSITLTYLGNNWTITNKTDDCVVGQSCWATNQIYVGSYNGHQYFTTPGGCTNSGTPTCAGGTDAVTKAWANNSGTTAYNVSTGASNYTYGATQSASLASTYTDTDAAKYCENMTYAGYSDWYLPASKELSFLYQQSHNISGFVYSSYYWSSTENGLTNAWYFYFGSGYITNHDKTNINYVRCVRRY